MRMWKRLIWVSLTQRSSRQWPTFPKLMPGPMWKCRSLIHPLGFEPEVSRSGYDVNLVRTNPTELGSASPVMAREDKMLDEVISRTPGAGRPGTDVNSGHTEED